jgi:NAD(P)H-flavin reductase
MVISYKNYKAQHGLSLRMATSDEQTLEVKGPMGKGLGIDPEGINVAFAAGTGVLVFVDLVAHLVRKNLGMLSGAEAGMLSSSFQFIFYASFPSRKESIALALLEGLQKLCKESGATNFKLVLRISDESKERWDTSFIQNSLSPLQDTVKKVWVCGPPKMNEDFERTLKFGMPGFPKCYEVL